MRAECLTVEVFRDGPGDDGRDRETCGFKTWAVDGLSTYLPEDDTRGKFVEERPIGIASATQQSDDADHGHLMEGLRQYLLMMAKQVIGPELQAKVGPSDLVQDTFLEAQRHAGGFQGRSEPEIRAWLRRILECRLANVRRSYLGTEKRAVAREVPLESVGSQSGLAAAIVASRAPSPSTHAVQNERAEALKRAMRRLPEHYRQAVAWRQEDGLSWEEIGQKMSCTAEAARKFWSRAIVQLKREVGDRDEQLRT
jgi:RNA polymerase sigma-70 factor (ECF subfamily)